MPSRAQYEAAAVAAGWTAHPNLTEEALALTRLYPDLHLRVWAQPDGVHCLAYMQQQDAGGRLITTEVARAVWRPSAVSQISVVDWGQRALSAWLARQLSPTEEQ